MVEWKETIYRNDIIISNTGIIKNKKTGHIYKSYITNGYHSFSSVKNKSLHRLLAEHFIPNPNNHNTVNHINEDKLDNRIENLEWVSQKQNINKFQHNNDKTLKFKIVDMYSLNNEYIKSFNNITDAAKELGLNRSAISKNCNGQNKSCNRHIFKFRIEEDHSVEDDMKEINDYPNYLISNNGKIYNEDKRRVLKHCKNANGNYYVSLVKNGVKKNYYVHRLVFQTYSSIIPDKKQVIHINGDKSNHYIDNLKLI